MKTLFRFVRLLAAVSAACCGAFSSTVSAQVFQTMRAWDSRPANPLGVLCKGADGNFYGTTERGGGENVGTVFRITPDGALTVIHSFTTAEGALPQAGLTLGADGFLYGTTSNYGANQSGMIFKISTTGVFTKLRDFNGTGVAYVKAAMILGTDGNFYGTASSNAVFKVTPAGVFTKLATLTAATGTTPVARLLQAPDGNFYGTTYDGGANSVGTIFKMTPAGVVSVLYNFPASGGGSPQNGLTLGADGNFYGTNSSQFYRITPAGAFTALYTFVSATGNVPTGDMVRSSDGFFYGTTIRGGLNGLGGVFRLSSTGQYTKLADFGGTTYSGDYASLIESNTAGTFMGVTNGRVSTVGSVFKVTTASVLTALTDFNITTGTTPSGPLTEGAGGNLFSTTTDHGASDGTVWRMAPDGTFATLLKTSYFDAFGEISGGLALGTDGLLYGTSLGSSSFNAGLVYKIAQTGGTATVVKNFPGSNPPNQPRGRLVQASDGNFYGTSLHAGYDQGCVYRVTSAGVLTVVKTFSSLDTDGQSPNGTLIIGSDGNLYGTTEGGGSNGLGTIFRVVPGATPVFTRLVSFINTSGQTPTGVLLAAPDGNIYGTTLYGGTNNRGTFFKLTTAGVHTVMASFGSTTASRPRGSIAIGTDGNFYGVTSEGGANAVGCVYRLTPPTSLTVLSSFTTAGPNTPMGGLTRGSDGNLYGTASVGGTAPGGSAFKITNAGVITHFAPFSYTTGSTPLGELFRASDGTLYGLNTTGGTGGGGTFFRVILTPIVTTTAATGVAITAATLNGTANPNGLAATASFDYSTSPTLASGVQNVSVTTQPGSGTAAVAVSATLSGLAPNTTYYFRLKASNAAGLATDGILSFTTLPAPTPTVVTQAATGVAQTIATLKGTVNPNGFSTTASFDYSTSPTLVTGVQTVSVAVQPGSGTSAVAVSAPVTGLAPNTTYYFRLGAANVGGAVTDGILSFATPPYPLPTVVTTAATGVGFTTGTLSGTVNPNGFSTTASFDYSTSPTLATGVQTVSVAVQPGSGTSAAAVSAPLTGLLPDTTYYFRLKATNIGGPAEDGILSFTTPIPPPAVATLAATAVIPTGGALNGTVNPNGFSTAASFDYGTSPTLAGTVVNVPVASAPGSGTAAVAVSAALTGLVPNTAYYFRLKAVNAGGAVQDGILSFTTPLPPPPVVVTGGASGVAQTVGSLAGTVNPNGGPTVGEFLVGTSVSLAGAVSFPAVPGAGSGTVAVAVGAGVTGLAANTTYYYALRASNAGGAGMGTVQSFATLPNPPTVTTLSASAVGFYSAVVNGFVRGNGAATTYGFDWGVSPALDQATAAQSLGNVSTTQLVSASLSGLALNTDYTFRVRATNGGGTTLGSVLAFSTPPLTVGGDGRYTLVGGKVWTLGQEFIVPGDLVVEGTLVPAGWRLTVLGTLTVRPAGAITDPAGKVRAFFRDGAGAAGVVADLAGLETLATLGLVGQQPMAALLEGGDGWMYGTAASGGKSGAGTVFRVKRTGEAEVLGNFTGPNGRAPQSALVGSAAGGVYGTATGGGAGGKGTVFRVNPAGGIVKVAELDGANGRAPSGGLTVGPDGLLYGVASRGGVVDMGTIFRVTALGAIEKLADFTGANGAIPQGALVLGSDGAFYGATTYGGAAGSGVVFRFSVAGGVVGLGSFSGLAGEYPLGALVEGAPGVFYGTCWGGGAAGLGTVYRLDGGGLVGMAGFSIAVGEGPQGALVRGADGCFYGTAYTGVNGYGAVFKVTDGGALSRVASVIGYAGTGSHPGAGLLLGADGAWYGVSQDGGAAGRGSVFRLLLSGVMENVASLTDSALPSGLTVGPVDGQLYGTTQRGGAIGYGSVFALAPRTPPVTLGSFSPGYGQEPQVGAGVVFGTDGTTLYGTAAMGGAGHGVVWKLPAGGAIGALVTFNGANGSGPLGGLVASGDGGFFGTTAEGAGSVFKVTVAGVVTPQGSLAGGVSPQAALAADGAGAFYGTTRAGGASGLGTVCRLVPGAGVSAVAEFAGANGAAPVAALLRGTDGTFAGSASAGGANGLGSLFTVTPGGAVSVLHSFAGAEGRIPRGALLGTGDGGFFGTASGGGAYGKGTLWRLGALGPMQVVAHFTGDNDGSSPGTGLTAAADGYLYGSTDTTIYRVPFAPSVTTLAASAFTPAQTTLRGEMQPRGLATTATFEWGTTPALGSTLAAGSSSGTGPVAVAATLPLAGGTTYYYRVKATNAMGVKKGSVLKFQTPALAAVAGGWTLPAGAAWTLPGDYTFGGDLTILGTLDTAGHALTVQGRLTVNGPLLNATGAISYRDRAGNLPPGAIRLLGDAAHDLADPDGDLLSNLMEFALGTNPGVFSPGALPVPAVVGGFLTLSYHTPAGIGGVQVVVEVSNDLANWLSGPGFTSVTGDTIANGVRTVSVRDDQGGALQYMRLRVTR